MDTAKDGTPNDGTSSEGTPNKRRRGGQPGNQNATRTGSRAHLLNLNGMPPKTRHIGRSVCRLRTLLEDAVKQVRGEITIVDACHIQSACRHEAVAQLTARQLQLSGDGLGLKIKLSYLQTLAKHSSLRDKCVEELRLTGAASNEIADYYAKGPSLPVESSGVQTSQTDDESEEGNATN